ncbi:winged helix-turn-helix domain-containing protein [Egicoccus sp. AB-alg6-2]|uniref:winged helix-turn-helix domain-containing protein n=1 Tax=Egicoccus sp. AB-alg6-2 TaxID=3242692 RepID=UPI00359D770A
MRTLSAKNARRIALTAMGFGRERPGADVRRDVRHLRRVVDTVDIVQLDSVNVLARAHELPFWSRIGPHDRAARDRWLWRSRELFEGWIHVASMTGVEAWPLFHHRRASTRRWERIREVEDRHPGYLDAVLEEIANHGPRSVRDLDDPGERSGPWWGMPKGRLALDYLAVRGDLTIHHRTPNFVAVYDLTERVIPSAVRDVEVLPLEETRERLLLRAVAAHGIGTAADLADHHRLVTRDVRPALARLVDRGLIEEVRVRGWGDEPVYRHPQAGAARTFPARTLLSPFDPLVWRRERALRVFDFHYRIEIYVPEPKRVYGYYVLPFLLGEDLVARVDLKADRSTGRLLVRSAFAEDGADLVHVARELAAELAALGDWLDVPEVVVEPRGDLAPALARAVG